MPVRIIDVTEETLPLFSVETGGSCGWLRFTEEPFSTEVEAAAHLEKIRAEYKVSADRIRVGAYTVRHWRSDLIHLASTDREATARCLELLSNAALVGVLNLLEAEAVAQSEEVQPLLEE